MSAATQTLEGLITGEELLAMGDCGPCELIDGKIVEMSPPGGEHGRIEIRLGRYLDVYVEDHHLGWVVGGETGIYTQRNPDRVRGVDVAFFTKEALPDGPPTAFIEAAPALVVEIMSPGNTWAEMRDKIREFFAIGAGEVWIVEPATRSLHRYHSPLRYERLGEQDTLVGTGALDGFTLPVADLFRR